MSRPWMPFYSGDYLRDTHHLSLEQHGAYLMLIMHYWNHGGLPMEPEQLKHILGLHGVNGENRWRSICLAIAPFFDGNWRHKRIEAELEKHELISTKRKVAGQIGGMKSRGHTNMGRYAVQAFAKQAGHQPQSKKESSTNSESEIAAAPQVAGEKRPGLNGGASPYLEANVQRKGWAP